jgi:uncharacterized protein (TIGR04255 family)
VALSIQFANLPKVTNVHGGLLWKKFADYPNCEEYPPLAPAFEIFGPNPVAGHQLEFFTGAPSTRYWFIEKDGASLLQFQPDRLIHNWRQQRPTDEYPRYEKIRQAFENEVSVFQRFLKEGDLGEVKPNQCEVIYINHIALPDGGDPRNSPQRIFVFWGNQATWEGLPGMEDAAAQLRFLLGDEGKYVGRLYAQVSPVLRRTDLKPFLQLTLTARGRPQSETVQAAFDFLDFGREAIVRGFKALTKPEMHRYWGIKA